MARPSIHSRELGVHFRASADAARKAKAALDEFTDNWIRSMGVRADLPNTGAHVQRDHDGADGIMLDGLGGTASRFPIFGLEVIESTLLPRGSVAYILDGRIYVPKYNRYGERFALTKSPLYTRHTLGSREAARYQRKRDKLR